MKMVLVYFLLLFATFCIPNVAKRSIWDQCKYVYFDNRPTSDRRPTSHLENFKWQYLRNGSSDPLHVWFQGGVFGGRRIKWRYFRFDQIQDGCRSPP